MNAHRDMTTNYGEAELNLYGPLGLLPVVSRMNTYWYRGYGDPPPLIIIEPAIARG